MAAAERNARLRSRSIRTYIYLDRHFIYVAIGSVLVSMITSVEWDFSGVTNPISKKIPTEKAQEFWDLFPIGLGYFL